MDAKRLRGPADRIDPAAGRTPTVGADGVAESVAVPRLASTGLRSDAAASLVADVLATLSGFTVSVLVTRFLVPLDRGVYFIATFASTLIAMFGDGGATIASLAYGASRRIAPQRLHGLALTVSISAALVGGGVLVALQPILSEFFLRGTDRLDAGIAAVGVVPLLYAQAGGALVGGMGLVLELSIARCATAIVAPIVVAPALILSHGSTHWALVSWLATTVASALGVTAVLAYARVRPSLPTFREARELLHFGMRGQIGTISHQGFLRIDALILNAWRGPATVGYYSLASVLAEKISLVGGALYTASASRLGSRAPGEASELSVRLVRLLLIALLPTAAVLEIIAHPMIVGIFGVRYSPAVAPFRILLIGTVFLSIWYLVGLTLTVGLHRPGTATLIQVLGFALAVPFYFVAISQWGMSGAATVSSLVYVGVLSVGLLALMHIGRVRLAALIPTHSDAAEIVRTLVSAVSHR